MTLVVRPVEGAEYLGRSHVMAANPVGNRVAARLVRVVGERGNQG